MTIRFFETLNSLQTQLLSQLLSSTTVRRLQDSELKTPADQDCYTMSEHLKLVFESVFSEILTPGAGQFTSRSQYLSTFRRSLQRSTLRTFSGLVTMSGYPDDARLLARTHLQTLEAKLAEVLAKNDLQLDEYSRAHVADLQIRVKQVLNAELVIPSAN